MRSFPFLLAGALVSVTALTTGCSGGGDSAAIRLTFDPCEPVTISPAPDLDASRLASIDHAIAMWNAVGVTQLSRDSGADAVSVGDPTTAPQDVPIEFQGAAQMFHGFYDDVEGVVYINQSLLDDHMRAVTIAHEMGHAFGLVHVSSSERSSVMNPGNLSVEPTADDVAALIPLWGACPRPGFTDPVVR